MKKQIAQLIEWHTKFEVPFRTEPCPFDDSDENVALLRLRARLMEEEVKEWKEPLCITWVALIEQKSLPTFFMLFSGQ